MIKDTYDYSTLQKEAGFNDVMRTAGNVTRKVMTGVTPVLLAGDLAARAYNAVAANKIRNDLYAKIDATVDNDLNIPEAQKERAKEVLRYHAETMPSEMQTNYGFNTVLQSTGYMDYNLPPETQKNIAEMSGSMYPKKADFFDGDTLSSIHSMLGFGHAVIDMGSGLYDFVQDKLSDKRGMKMIDDLSQSIPERDRDKWKDAAEYVLQKNPLLIDKPITFKDTVDAAVLDNGVGTMRDISTFSAIGIKGNTNPIRQLSQRNGFQSTMNHLNQAQTLLNNAVNQPDYAKHFGSPIDDAAQAERDRLKAEQKAKEDAVREERKRQTYEQREQQKAEVYAQRQAEKATLSEQQRAQRNAENDARYKQRQEERLNQLAADNASLRESINNANTWAGDLLNKPIIDATQYTRHHDPEVAELARAATKLRGNLMTAVPTLVNNPHPSKSQVGNVVGQITALDQYHNRLHDLVHGTVKSSSSLFDQLSSLMFLEPEEEEKNKQREVLRSTYIGKSADFGTSPTPDILAQLTDGISMLTENLVETGLLEKAKGSLQLISVAENAK